MTQPSHPAITIDPNTPLPEASGYLMGSATAPVQILEFADFECPACASFATLTEPDMRKRLMTELVCTMWNQEPVGLWPGWVQPAGSLSGSPSFTRNWNMWFE
jgi:hypothetical protein